MAFFSMESTKFKTWLVANQKLWGAIPLIICAVLSYLLLMLFNKNTEFGQEIFFWCLIPAFIIEAAFTVAEQNEKPNLIYGLLGLVPLTILILVFMGKINHPFFTTGTIIWSCIAMLAAFVVAYIIGTYANRNYDDVVSRLFVFKASVLDYISSQTTFVFRRSVEAFLFSFFSLEMFAPLFA